MDTVPCKLAVVGCGALGSFYGARLWRLGLEVHFLLRSDYDVVRREGVHIQSYQGDFVARPHSAREPGEIGVCDVVLIGLKTTANAELSRLLLPLVGPATCVVTLQNGLGNEETLARLVGAERIFGGLCFVCLNRVAPGVVHHLAHGRVVLGEFRRPAGPRARQLAEWLRQAEVPCELTDHLERAHWEKLAWNIPFNGLGVAGAAGYAAMASGVIPANACLGACLPTDALLSDPRWETLALGLMQEVIRVANALGYEAPATWADEQIARTRCMGAYWASTLIDFARGLPLELDSLFLEPLRQARAAGVDTPLLERLCAVLTALDRRQRLSGPPGVA